MTDRSSPLADRLELAAARIAAHNGAIRSMITPLVDEARASLAAGTQEGGLSGVIVSVKDNIDTAGIRTTRGSGFFADRIPNGDATVVERLRRAGATIIGKDNLHEFAFGATSQNPHHGLCRNPWNLETIPGGSSGGAGASVAAGFSEVAIGTDTGGSVRIPAALNGVSGLRPTVGRISNHGVMPLSDQYDTVGPLARRVVDVADAYEAIAGYDPRDAYSVDRPVEGWRSRHAGGLHGLKIGIPSALIAAESEPEVVVLIEAAIRALTDLGAIPVEIAIEGAADAHVAYMTIVQSDAAAVHAERMATSPKTFGADVEGRLRMGGEITGQAYSIAQRKRAPWMRQVGEIFDRVDMLAMPTVGFPAPLAAGPDGMIATTHRLTRLTSIWSFAELPGLSVPCGFSRGLPIGLQLVGPKWSEASLLATGAAYQGVTDFHRQLPPLLR